MNLIIRIEEGVLKDFNEQTKAIQEFDPLYKRARDYCLAFCEEKLDQYRRELDDHTVEALERTAKTELAALKSSLNDKSITIEFLLNRGTDNVELLLPIRQASQTSLEEDVMRHAIDVFLSYDSGAQIGSFDQYLSLVGNIRDATGMVKDKRKKITVARMIKDLKSAKKPMEFAKIVFNVHELRLTDGDVGPVLFGNYEGTQREIVIHLTQSAIDYKLIPLRKRHREFFPGYKSPFTISHSQGQSFRAQVTSMTSRGRGGNYICSTGCGSLGDYFRIHRLRSTSELRLSELVPMSVYQLEVNRR